jgi:PIN domain nuclease of toxin-antitoxin system
MGLGKIELSIEISELFGDSLEVHGVEMLSIDLEDAAAYALLGFPDPNHRDPFDRMLIVQAQRRNLAVVSADAKLDAYSVTRTWQ